jgi:hypothetical protein
MIVLESLSLAQTRGRRRPRVAIVVQTVSDLGMKLRGDLPKWRASSLDWCANPRSKPEGVARRGRQLACCVRAPPRVTTVVPIPPRVVIVVPARGSASSSSCYRGSNPGQYPWCKNYGCRYRGKNRGETNVSVLCSRPSSSRDRGVNRGVQPRGASSSSSCYRGSNRGSAPSSSRYRGANPVVQPRVVIRGGRRTVRVVLAWLQPRFNPVVQPRVATR